MKALGGRALEGSNTFEVLWSGKRSFLGSWEFVESWFWLGVEEGGKERCPFILAFTYIVTAFNAVKQKGEM